MHMSSVHFEAHTLKCAQLKHGLSFLQNVIFLFKMTSICLHFVFRLQCSQNQQEELCSEPQQQRLVSET